MMCVSPLFSQKIEIKYGAIKEKASEVLFIDDKDNILGRLEIAKNNPFNQLSNQSIKVDELGNKTYIVSQEEFLHLFPEKLRAKYSQVIDYSSMRNARLSSITHAFKTSNKYLTLAYCLVADDFDTNELYAIKCIIKVYDSTMNEIFSSEVVPSIDNYAAVTLDGKYLAIQNGAFDGHTTLYADGIQILDIKTKEIVYNTEAIVYGPSFDDDCQMVTFIMMLPIGYRYMFLNSTYDCLLYFDIVNVNESIIELTKDGIFIRTSPQDTYYVKFKEMNTHTLK